MQSVHFQRCHLHPEREAVARCPECRRFYCRECVTEHDDRVVCANCLRRLTARAERRPPRRRAWLGTAEVVLSFLLLWLVFYSVGRVLLRLPSAFHEGTRSAEDVKGHR